MTTPRQVFVLQAHYICGDCAVEYCNRLRDEITSNPDHPPIDFDDSMEWPHHSNLFEADTPTCASCSKIFTGATIN